MLAHPFSLSAPVSIEEEKTILRISLSLSILALATLFQAVEMAYNFVS
jgi:hypothetical protein